MTYTAAVAAFKTDSTKRAKDSIYNVTSQFDIPIKKYTENADSVMIAMADGNGFAYRKTVAATDSVAKFAPNDFAGAGNYDISTFIMEISAIKYHNQQVSGKKYYFLQMASYLKYSQTSK